MRAIDFIKDHGVEKAREVVEGAPTLDCDFDPYDSSYMSQVHQHEWEMWKEDIKRWDVCEWDVDVSDYILVSDLKRLVESVDIISKFDSVQEAKDAISNSPDGATDYRKLSCTIRYIKQSERFFEYWDGSIWCRPTVPFTEETHILRFTELSRLKQAIADYEGIGGEHV